MHHFAHDRFVFVTPVPGGHLKDSRCFNGDPPHLTLNQVFPVIWLSRTKKVA